MPVQVHRPLYLGLVLGLTPTRGNWKGPRYFTGVGPSIFLP
jgi:hypothetical protein